MQKLTVLLTLLALLCACALGEAAPTATPEPVGISPATGARRGAGDDQETETLYQQAHEALAVEDFDRLYALSLEAAEAGNILGQYYLGVCYYAGHGVEQDAARAAEYFRLAADRGHAMAQGRLAYLYLTGRGVEQDTQAAFDWYLRAAEQGDPYSQYDLAIMYRDGEGVEPDIDRAIELFALSAGQGLPVSALSLGAIYATDKYDRRDAQNSHQWYEAAAELGDPTGQYAAGCNYYFGEGVAVDLEMAGYWWRAAAEQGHPEAMHNLAGLLVSDGEYDEALYWLETAVSLGGDSQEMLDRLQSALSEADGAQQGEAPAADEAQAQPATRKWSLKQD